MSGKELNDVIVKFDTKTTSEWAESTKIIAQGALALEDVGDGSFKAKIGDGEHFFAELPYFGGEITQQELDDVLQLYETKTSALEALSKKIDAVEGMGLSENSFTNADKQMLSDKVCRNVLSIYSATNSHVFVKLLSFPTHSAGVGMWQHYLYFIKIGNTTGILNREYGILDIEGSRYGSDWTRSASYTRLSPFLPAEVARDILYLGYNDTEISLWAYLPTGHEAITLCLIDKYIHGTTENPTSYCNDPNYETALPDEYTYEEVVPLEYVPVSDVNNIELALCDLYESMNKE